jgi:hypothetical protein
MNPRNRLVAAVTTSGLVLSLSFPAEGKAPTQDAGLSCSGGAKPLSLSVEAFREKLQGLSPALGDETTRGKVKNIVQFLNCFRPGWRNC